MTSVVGNDGLTYDYTNGKLTISGIGPMTSLNAGKVDSSKLDASGMTSCEIQSGVTTISDYAFSSCKNFASLVIAPTVTTIGVAAFLNFSNLTEVRFPASVQEIKASAFNYCYGVTKLIFEGQPQTIANNALAFTGVSTSKTITVYSSGWLDATEMAKYSSGKSGNLTFAFVAGLPASYNYLMVGGKKAQVESARRDEDGYRIKTTYAKKSELFSGDYDDLSNKPSLATVATSGSYNDLSNKPTIPSAVTVDSSLSGSSTNPVQNKVVKKALDGKLDNYTIETRPPWTGGYHPMKFLTVNYTNDTSETASFFKIGMICTHGGGSAFRFYQDVIFNVQYTGTVKVDIYRYFADIVNQNNGDYYLTKYYGDIFWTIDTTNKIVDFYIIMGQYVRMKSQPYTFLGNTSHAGVITQISGNSTDYSTGTISAWASVGDIGVIGKGSSRPTFNGNALALYSDIPTVPDISGKLDKVDTADTFGRVYSVAQNGTQQMIRYTGATLQYSLAYRNVRGTLNVATPEENDHATNKAYVDGLLPKIISNTSVSSWSADNTYADYPYRASIAITGVTANDTAEVVFAVAQATSGDYAPVCETYAGGVYIYSAVNDSITIPTIIVFKG